MGRCGNQSSRSQVHVTLCCRRAKGRSQLRVIKLDSKSPWNARYRPFQTRASATGRCTGMIGRYCLSPAGTSCCIGDAPSFHPQPPLIQRDSQTESPDPPWPYLSHSCLACNVLYTPVFLLPSLLLSSLFASTSTPSLLDFFISDSLLPDPKKLAIPSNQFSSTSA